MISPTGLAGRIWRAVGLTGVILEVLAVSTGANTSIHTTYLWHLHQPIYWPDRSPYNPTDHYQNGWDTMRLQDGGFPHPVEQLRSQVFQVDDRIAIYQYRLKDTLSWVDVSLFPNQGAQVSYSGALIENVQSLAGNGVCGSSSGCYNPGWPSSINTARGWTTSGGKPRLDMVNFTYHHCLAPFVSDETLEMELRLQQRQMQMFWTSLPGQSRGYFPAETCFSERIIPVLKKVGIDWSLVANNHLTRSCSDFPLVLGSGGENCDIPNRADQVNPTQGPGNYKTISISRGCGPTAAMPFAFQVHYARYVDPNTGNASMVMVVPADQALGWQDSYSTWDLNQLGDLNTRNNPSKPSLLTLAHDGDNAWSGGYSYYHDWVPQFAGAAKDDGYEPTTVEQFLSEFPPDSNDVVHVEDGGWVYADSDFGSPIMINWHWPPSYSTNVAPYNIVDPSLGVSDKADAWRVIIATENRVRTAQQIQNTLTGYTNRIDQIRDPGSFGQTPSAVELGWHYYLAGLDSGFVYFGCHDDECWRQVLAQSNACRNVDSILSGNPTLDTTPPTVLIPQRHPWNPGTTNFGVQYRYNIYTPPNSDFWVWTYAYDVSGITNVTLFYRSNGYNPPTQDQFKTYAGGPNTGPWIGLLMTQRIVAPQNSVLPPKYIADYYYARVTGLTNTYVDYYVSATDSYANTYNSPIQHVYVAKPSTGAGGTPGCTGRVCVSPSTPVTGNPVTITFSPAGGPLASASKVYIHLGWNDWNPVISPDAAMTFDGTSNVWGYTTTVTNIATQLDCVFNNGAGTWDNNSGQDWHFTVISTPQPPPTPGTVTTTPVSATQISVNWGASGGATGYVVKRDGSQIATTSATSYTDSGLVTGSNYCYTVAATNSVGSSSDSAAACTSISGPPTPQNVIATGVATNQINLVWSASAGAAGYIIERGGNPIAMTSSTNYNDIGLSPSTQYCYMIAATNAIGSSLFSPPVCATTMSPPLAPPFVLNGSASNYPGYLLSSPGMTLYAAIRGTTLYVATWSPGTNGPNDHFILVSDQILASATTPALWAKAGTIAIPANKVMLAGESQNNYVDWQTITGSSLTASNQATKAPTSSGQMQGTIDLVQAFGSMPSTLYMCAAAYATTNGGALVAQAPAGNGDGNIDPGEFLAVPVASIADSNGDGLLDNLDPSIGFVVQNIQPSDLGGFTLTWVAIPGKTYEVMYCDSLGDGWTNLPNAQLTAGSGQVLLSYTDTSATNTPQRFYRIDSP